MTRKFEVILAWFYRLSLLYKLGRVQDVTQKAELQEQLQGTDAFLKDKNARAYRQK